MRITNKLPNPESVAAGGTATFRIPVGRRIHSLLLGFQYNATTQNVADFTEIRVYINGQVAQRFSGTQRNVLNQFDGIPSADSASVETLRIPFDRIGLLTRAGQEETALNTGVADGDGRRISSVYVEVDLDSGMTVGASDLTMHAEQSDAVQGGPGTIPYLRSETRSVAGADSDFQISDLVNPGVNAPDKVALNRVTFIPSTGSITRMRIDRNAAEIFDRTDALNRFIQNGGKRTAQSGYYTIDTTEHGYAGNMIQLHGMQDYRYRLSCSAAMTITALSEYIGILTA